MQQIYLRLTQKRDLTLVNAIIAEARQLLQTEKSPQWQASYPTKDIIEADLKHRFSFVLIYNNKIIGTAALVTGINPDYQEIYEGKWQYPQLPYATIHRLAIGKKYRGRGFARFLISNLLTLSELKGVKDVRIDTHYQNLRVQKIAKSFGFNYCGWIKVKDPIDPKRLAYELKLS